EIARSPRAPLHHVDRNEAADIFVLIDDGALERVGVGQVGRRRCCLLLGLAASGKQGRKSNQSGSQDSGGCRHEVGPKVMTNTGYMRREDRPGQWSRPCERRGDSSPPAQRTPSLWGNPQSPHHLPTAPAP